MEGFATFPYCAACGTRLPDVYDDHAHTAWRRPLRSTLWAAVIGCAVLGLALYATNFFEAAPKEASSLIVAKSDSFTARVGEQIRVPLVLSRSPAAMSGNNQRLENVTLRLPRDLLKNFQLRSLEPAPDSHEKRGNGLYYRYSSLPEDAAIQVVLLPLRSGVFQVSAKVLSGAQLQDNRDNEFETSVNVTKAVS
jgi:hypothetical protein